MTIRTRDFTLASWQQDALAAWIMGDGTSMHRGCLEIFTGGGKTLIALECLRVVSELNPVTKYAVVVPTEALAHQWIRQIRRYTTLDAADVGLLGAGSSHDLSNHHVVVAVLNSATRRLPGMAAEHPSVMLIVDECHRAGAPVFSKVLSTPAAFRLGLSATPEREEFDDDGEPLEFDEQLVGRLLGGVVYRFTLRQAREAGWLPEYEIHHHGILLLEEERRKYEEMSNRIDELADKLAGFGVDGTQARAFCTRPGDIGQIAQAYVAATSARKDLLYRAKERERVAVQLFGTMLQTKPGARTLFFHERVNEAVGLYERLTHDFPSASIALEHSRLPATARQAALDAFRAGAVQALVSVKSLVEGIDVPDADVGVSVASSASVRQRIQSLGRVLRRGFDEDREPKRALMHLIYVRDTVDEVIYGKEDWADLTGDATNRYWSWASEAGVQPEPLEGPPRRPRPTEDQEWSRIGSQVPQVPVEWHAALPNQEYTVDTRGNVSTARGLSVLNPQGVDHMISLVRGRPGGRFQVTRLHRLVLVWDERSSAVFLAGQLAEPFELEVPVRSGSVPPPDSASLTVGATYQGPADDINGTFKLRQKQGGVIERRTREGLHQFALTTSSDTPDLVENARRVLANWRSISHRGLTFMVNTYWHAWYREQGEPRFLGGVPGGFAWPPAGPDGGG